MFFDSSDEALRVIGEFGSYYKLHCVVVERPMDGLLWVALGTSGELRVLGIASSQAEAGALPGGRKAPRWHTAALARSC